MSRQNSTGPVPRLPVTVRAATRAAATVVIVGVLSAMTTACSTDRDAVDPALWRQLDAAQNVMYRELTSPSAVVGTPQDLFERLSAALDYWDGKTPSVRFSDARGTAVFYDFRDDAGGDASFQMFVTSGRTDNPAGERVFPAEPQRVYTCYRIDVAFTNGVFSGFFRGSDSDERRLDCPQELVDALGDRSQYREPWLFDG